VRVTGTTPPPSCFTCTVMFAAFIFTAAPSRM
jgi:hypothetical protein